MGTDTLRSAWTWYGGEGNPLCLEMGNKQSIFTPQQLDAYQVREFYYVTCYACKLQGIDCRILHKIIGSPKTLNFF